MAQALAPAWASPTGTMLDVAGGSCLAGGACMVSQATFDDGVPDSLRHHCTVLATRQADHSLAAWSSFSAAHKACPLCDDHAARAWSACLVACCIEALSVMHGWHECMPDPLGGLHFAGSLHS